MTHILPCAHMHKMEGNEDIRVRGREDSTLVRGVLYQPSALRGKSGVPTLSQRYDTMIANTLLPIAALSHRLTMRR